MYIYNNTDEWILCFCNQSSPRWWQDDSPFFDQCEKRNEYTWWRNSLLDLLLQFSYWVKVGRMTASDRNGIWRPKNKKESNSNWGKPKWRAVCDGTYKRMKCLSQLCPAVASLQKWGGGGGDENKTFKKRYYTTGMLFNLYLLQKSPLFSLKDQ